MNAMLQRAAMDCPPPLIKPIDANGRGEYETGKQSFNDPAQPSIAFETQANILQQPGWLTMLSAAFPSLDDEENTFPAWLLLFDLTTDLVNKLFSVATGLIPDGAIARYSMGPVRASDMGISGGSVWYEATAEEVPCRTAIGQFPSNCPPGDRPRLPPDVKGMPFNFGIIAVVSATPRILTTVTSQDVSIGLSMAVTARMQA